MAFVFASKFYPLLNHSIASRYDKIKGLPDAFETPGVCSNYSPLYVEKTTKAIQDFKVPVPFFQALKVPKCEIFDRSDINDFYTIESLCEGDFGVKIKKII